MRKAAFGDPYNSRSVREKNSHWPVQDKHTSGGCAPAQANREDPCLRPLITGRKYGNSSLHGFDGQLGISQSGNWGCALLPELPSKTKQSDQHQKLSNITEMAVYPHVGGRSSIRRCMLLLLLTCFFCLRVSIQQKYKLYLKFSVLLVQLMLPNIYILSSHWVPAALPVM